MSEHLWQALSDADLAAFLAFVFDALEWVRYGPDAGPDAGAKPHLETGDRLYAWLEREAGIRDAQKEAEANERPARFPDPV